MSLRSMTGFGQASTQVGATLVKVELRTVNHRFAEFSVRMPRELMALEDSVRKCLSEYVARGRVDAYVSVETASSAEGLVAADWTLFDALRNVELEALRRVGLNEDAAAAPIEWLQHPDVLRVERASVDLDAMRLGVVDAVSAACNALVDMRNREGERLAADLQGKIAELSRIIAGVKERAPAVTEAFRSRLHTRIAELGVEIDEQRLAAEVTLFAERAAIDEELVRLDSHVKEFHLSVDAGSPVGRRLDFIIQEMQRELNTIASKASDLEISKAVVDAKAIVEQLREQVQNIE